jgi:predicted aldo/keto reductase-like oxidoreductase
MPCPEGIDVPRVFEIYNDAFVYDDAETARSIYRSELHQVERCTQCRYCEDRCVKKLPILEWLDEARRLLTN